MSKRVSLVLGLVLIGVGGLALLFTLGGAIFGWHIMAPWQLWPLLVIGVGLFLCIAPLRARGKRGLGALWIPGVPILATGGLLLIGSLLHWWEVWTYLWPTIVLGLALGFLLAAVYMRVIWLVIPGIIIGANGVLMQFCALTGLWGVWAVLWTIEPLSVGLALLVCWIQVRSRGLFWAGLILCGIAAALLLMMAAILNWWVVGVVGPIVLVLVGGLLVVRALGRRAAVEGNG